MADKTKIEWTDATWNPVTGCTKVSAGCKHCYAQRIAERFAGTKGWENGFDLTLHPERLRKPMTWKLPKMIFVNSMSDIFHEDIDAEYIKQIFQVMRDAHWHTFQVLTKRSERLARAAAVLDWPPNVWMGVSVENQEFADIRLSHLREVPAAVKFLSVEPLLGPITFEPGTVSRLDHIDWVIVGGESGPGCRRMDPDWVRSIRDQCRGKVKFFFKQWGGVHKKEGDRVLDGRTWEEMPARLQRQPELF